MKHPTPHQLRVQNIKSWFYIIGLAMFLIYAYGCKSQNGCGKIIHKKKFTALLIKHADGWFQNVESGRTCILDKDSGIIYTYIETSK
jgi:hypothetical protein